MKASGPKIRFKAEYAIIAHSANTVELRAGVWNPRSLTLTDERESGTLLPMLKALHAGGSPAEIASAAGVARSEAEALLDSLLDAGVVSSEQTGALNALLERQSSLPMVEAELTNPVFVVGDDAVSTAIRRQLGDELGNSVTCLGQDDPLVKRLFQLDSLSLVDGLERERIFEEFAAWKGSVIACTMTTLNPIAFAALDEIAQGVGFVWIHGVVDGPYVLVGPTIIPGRTATYADLERRFMMNMRELASYQKYKAALADKLVTDSSHPLAGTLVDLLASHVSMELLNWLKSGSNFTINRVLGIYLPTMEMAFHEVLPSPFGSAATSLQSRDATDLYFNVRDWLDA